MNITITYMRDPRLVAELKQLKAGEVFYYDTLTFSDACVESDFWMRVEAPEVKGRVRVVNLSDGRQQERDEDHRVVRVKASLSVENEAELVDAARSRMPVTD